MGFSHDGGGIDVSADDVKDTASRDEIRAHFQHIVAMSSAGNFNIPMLVHAQNVPVAATMTRLKDRLQCDMQETRSGARITIVEASACRRP